MLYSQRIKVRQINVNKEYKAEASITGYSGEIRQIFANLIGNAIDAMPRGGLLRLKISGGQDWSSSGLRGVRVSVADTGSGIEKQHINRIFEPFYTTKKDVGTGLGLWLTKTLIEHHSGSIRVRSRTGAVGCGTVFSVFFPHFAEQQAVA
jgi:signal transduction histidine kinase